jgi:hypothetical protein
MQSAVLIAFASLLDADALGLVDDPHALSANAQPATATARTTQVHARVRAL